MDLVQAVVDIAGQQAESKGKMETSWIDWREIVSYIVSALCYFGNKVIEVLPHTCDGWTKVIGLIIALLTLFFITLPKAWPNIRKVLGGSK